VQVCIEAGASFHVNMREQFITSACIEEGREVPTLSFFPKIKKIDVLNVCRPKEA
jgi:hypothetical protein